VAPVTKESPLPSRLDKTAPMSAMPAATPIWMPTVAEQLSDVLRHLRPRT